MLASLEPISIAKGTPVRLDPVASSITTLPCHGGPLEHPGVTPRVSLKLELALCINERGYVSEIESSLALRAINTCNVREAFQLGSDECNIVSVFSWRVASNLVIFQLLQSHDLNAMAPTKVRLVEEKVKGRSVGLPVPPPGGAVQRVHICSRANSVGVKLLPQPNYVDIRPLSETPNRYRSTRVDYDAIRQIDHALGAGRRADRSRPQRPRQQ